MVDHLEAKGVGSSDVALVASYLDRVYGEFSGLGEIEVELEGLGGIRLKAEGAPLRIESFLKR